MLAVDECLLKMVTCTVRVRVILPIGTFWQKKKPETEKKPPTTRMHCGCDLSRPHLLLSSKNWNEYSKNMINTEQKNEMLRLPFLVDLGHREIRLQHSSLL